jgi:hypothetical protein
MPARPMYLLDRHTGCVPYLSLRQGGDNSILRIRSDQHNLPHQFVTVAFRLEDVLRQ